jgi:hypothetical protein
MKLILSLLVIPLYLFMNSFTYQDKKTKPHIINMNIDNGLINFDSYSKDTIESSRRLLGNHESFYGNFEL